MWPQEAVARGWLVVRGVVRGMPLPRRPALGAVRDWVLGRLHAFCHGERGAGDGVCEVEIFELPLRGGERRGRDCVAAIGGGQKVRRGQFEWLRHTFQRTR